MAFVLLANPYVLIAAAIATVVAGLIMWNKSAEKRAAAEAEAQKAEHDRIKQQQEERQKIEALAQDYEELAHQYDRGAASKEALVKAGSELEEQLGSEQVRLAQLTGNYHSLTEAVKVYRQELLDTMATEAKKQTEAAKGAFMNTAVTEDGYNLFGDYNLKIGGWFKSTSGEILEQALDDANISHWQTTFGQNLAVDQTPEEILKLYDTLVEAREKMLEEGGDSVYSEDTFVGVSEWLNKMEETATNLRNSQKAESDIEIDKFLARKDVSDVKYYDDYRDIRDTLRNTLGFEGVVMTDMLNDTLITANYSDADAAVSAILAGADILFVPADYQKAYEGVMQAVADGTITEERIQESLMRIYRVKYKHALDNVE